MHTRAGSVIALTGFMAQVRYLDAWAAGVIPATAARNSSGVE